MFTRKFFRTAHEINNTMGIIHARGSDLMEAAAESATIASARMISTMEKIRDTASRVTNITMGPQKFASETRNDPATETGVREILEDTLAFCVERLSINRWNCGCMHAVQESPERWSCR